jgi:hypothetical protein
MTSAIDNMARAEDAPQRLPSQQEEGNGERGDDHEQQRPSFILYLDGPEYEEALFHLARWVRHLLLPVYGRETTSTAPWCARWWEHREAVAQFYGLWMAWQQFTGPGSDMAGPAMWHRDFLLPLMGSLRDPSGPFAGCKSGMHRPKEIPLMDEF